MPPKHLSLHIVHAKYVSLDLCKAISWGLGVAYNNNLKLEQPMVGYRKGIGRLSLC